MKKCIVYCVSIILTSSALIQGMDLTQSIALSPRLKIKQNSLNIAKKACLEAEALYFQGNYKKSRTLAVVSVLLWDSVNENDRKLLNAKSEDCGIKFMESRAFHPLYQAVHDGDRNYMQFLLRHKCNPFFRGATGQSEFELVWNS